MSEPEGFVPPPYPYDRLTELVRVAEALPGGAVDLSIGTPCDAPPAVVLEALAGSGTERAIRRRTAPPRSARRRPAGSSAASA